VHHGYLRNAARRKQGPHRPHHAQPAGQAQRLEPEARAGVPRRKEGAEDRAGEARDQEAQILAEITAVKNGVSLPASAHVAAAKEKLGASIACATS